MGPRTTRSKNRLHMSGETQAAHPPDTRKGGLHCEPELPTAPSKAAITSIPLHPWNHRPAWSSIPGVTRGVQGPCQEPPLCQKPVDQCPLPPRHPCHCTRDWTWTQFPEGFQACQGRSQDQGPSPKRIVPSVGTESKPDPEA